MLTQHIGQRRLGAVGSDLLISGIIV